MNPNPLNRQLPHEEAIRRFLERINADSQPKQQPQPQQHQSQPDQPKICHLTTDELVTQEAAEELAHWFKK